METRIVPPYHLVQLGKLQEDFHSETAKFMHLMSNGGGLKNMSLGDTIRRLNFIYLQIAAHLDAARDVDGNVSLDTGHYALARVRAMATENDRANDE